MSNTPAFSIVIPCHNEADHIGPLLRRMNEAFDGAAYEVIVVLDGCTDDSERVVGDVARSMPAVRMLVNDPKRGKGGAIRRGILDAKGAYVGFIDGDNEIDPRFLRHAFSALEKGKSEIVIGNRYCPGAAYHTTAARHVTSRAYQSAIWILFGLRLGDTQAGLKTFTAEAGKHLFRASNVNGYAFDIDVLTHALWMGYSIAQIPIRQRFKGTSSIAHRHVLEMIADTCGTYDRHAREIFRRWRKHPSAGPLAAVRSVLFFPFTTALEYGLRRWVLRQK